MADLRGGASLVVRGHPVEDTLAVAMEIAGEDAVQLDGNDVLLDVTPERAPDLTRALVARGVDVHQIGSAERTLESVFFEMTTDKEAVS